jgi:hypothetical protein
LRNAATWSSIAAVSNTKKEKKKEVRKEIKVREVKKQEAKIVRFGPAVQWLLLVWGAS